MVLATVEAYRAASLLTCEAAVGIYSLAFCLAFLRLFGGGERSDFSPSAASVSMGSGLGLGSGSLPSM